MDTSIPNQPLQPALCDFGEGSTSQAESMRLWFEESAQNM